MYGQGLEHICDASLQLLKPQLYRQCEQNYM
jgi:hypothetical protein